MKEVTKKFVKILQSLGFVEATPDKEDLYTNYFTEVQEPLVDLLLVQNGQQVNVICKSNVPELAEDMIFLELEQCEGEKNYPSWGQTSPASILIQEVQEALYKVNLTNLRKKAYALNPIEDFQTWIPMDNQRGRYALGWAFEVEELVAEGIAQKIS